MAKTHRSSPCRATSEHENGRVASVRRPERQGAERSDGFAQRKSESQAHHGDLLARCARCRRSRQASGQNRQGEGYWSRIAERKPPLREGRRHRQRDSVEDRRPWLSDRARGGGAGEWETQNRRKEV